MKIERAYKNERLMRALTGMNKEEFEELEKSFERCYLETKTKIPRKREYGGGRKGALKDIKTKLFFILFYLKTYPTFDLAGFIFGVDRSRPCDWKNQYLPILESALGQECVLPKRKISSIEEFAQSFPELKDLFVDGTERPTRRPKDPKNQKRRYSGKKKRHTRKNTVWCDENQKILLISPTKNGRIHDKKQHDKNGGFHEVPLDIHKWLDSGYQGVQKNSKNVHLPKKGSKKNPLSRLDKAENYVISHFRIVVEQAIGGIKRYGCLSQIYRNFKGIDDKFMLICAGLWNFHLKFR